MVKYANNQGLFISALTSGEHEAYTYLMQAYHHKLCVYALGLCNSNSLAEDIVQNAFLKIWRKRGQLASVENLNSYLHRVVRNEFIDNYRGKKPVDPLEEYYINTLTEVVEEELDVKAITKIVRSEIDNLPDRIRETFTLSKLDGLSNQEIAEYKNISIKTVESHLTKSIKLLRKALKSKIKDFYLVTVIIDLFL